MELSLDVLLSVSAWNQIDDCNFTEPKPQMMYPPPAPPILHFMLKGQRRWRGEAKDDGNKMRKRERRTEF